MLASDWCAGNKTCIMFSALAWRTCSSIHLLVIANSLENHLATVDIAAGKTPGYEDVNSS